MNEEITIREYLETIINERCNRLESIVNERDKQYDMRFRAAEIAVNAALASQQKNTADAFLASENAIEKAENAQKEYNIAHNDLSRKLDEQNKATVPRPETTALFKAADEKLAALQSNYDSKIEAIRENLTREIAGLRESRSAGEGKTTGANALWGYIVGGFGLLLGMIGTITAIIFHFVK